MKSINEFATEYAQDKYLPVQTSQAIKAGANYVFYGICMQVAESTVEWQKNPQKLISEDYDNALHSEALTFLQEQQIAPNLYADIIIRAVKHGAKWQKEQIVKSAIDGIITFDYYDGDDKEYGCIAHDSFCLEDTGLKDRDKVKIVVIK